MTAALNSEPRTLNPEPMLLVGIGGSPRRGGNSDLLLDEALRGAAGRGARTRKLLLCELGIAPCRACDGPGEDEPCAVRDGMDAVYGAVRDADAVILASPIYFGSLSAQMKAMIDRFQCVWLAGRRRGVRFFPGERACAFIAVSAGDRPDFFANARAIARNWSATLHARWGGELYCPGVERKGIVGERPEMLQAARELGERLVSGTNHQPKG